MEEFFPEIKIVRTPRVVTAICECIGSVGSRLSFIPDLGLTHGQHLPSALKVDDPRPQANELIN